MRNKILKIAGPIVVIGMAVVANVVLQKTAPVPEKTEEGPRPVSLFVESAMSDDLQLTVKTQGEVRPHTEIELVAQVSGRVVSVAKNFASGGAFEDGATLIKIDDADYKLAVTRAEARVAAAKTQVQLTEASAHVAKRNWDNSIVGKPTALAMKLPQLEEARANLLSAQADLQAARLNLQRTNVSVPFNGRVRTKMADIGQYVTPGAPLGRVYSTEVAEIRLALNDSQLASLSLPIGYQENGKEGPRVKFTGIFAGAPRTWYGRIVRTDAAIDSNTRTLYAVAQVDAPYGEGADDGVPMAMGLFVSAEIDGSELQDAIVIPRSAIRSGDQVYVVTKDGTLDIRTISIGYSDSERAVVNSGLSVGEQVVVSPVRAPRQGMKVAALQRQSSLHLASAERQTEGG